MRPSADRDNATPAPRYDPRSCKPSGLRRASHKARAAAKLTPARPDERVSVKVLAVFSGEHANSRRSHPASRRIGAPQTALGCVNRVTLALTPHGPPPKDCSPAPGAWRSQVAHSLGVRVV